MSYRHGHLLPIMGNGDESANVNTGTNLLAYCSFPKSINDRWAIELKMVATKANSGSANYKLLVREDGNTAFSTEQEASVAVTQNYTEPETFTATMDANSYLVSHAVTSGFGCELRQTIASGSYGHYIWSPMIEVRVR